MDKRVRWRIHSSIIDDNELLRMNWNNGVFVSLVTCVKNLQTSSLFNPFCTQFHRWERLRIGKLIWFNFSLSLHKTIFFWHDNKLPNEESWSKTFEDGQEGEGDKVCIWKDYDMFWNTSQNGFKQWPTICKLWAFI